MRQGWFQAIAVSGGVAQTGAPARHGHRLARRPGIDPEPRATLLNVLMLGWEYPPHISGGLGTACAGLTAALANAGVAIAFVVPQAYGDETAAHMRLVAPDDLDLELERHALAMPYAGQRRPDALIAGVQRHADRVVRLARGRSFDVVHAHDWLTWPAGVAVARRSGRPLVVHVHSLEHDRSEHPDPRVVAIEAAGLWAADRVVAVSHFTRRRIQAHHGIPGDRIAVVHNGVEMPAAAEPPRAAGDPRPPTPPGRPRAGSQGARGDPAAAAQPPLRVAAAPVSPLADLAAAPTPLQPSRPTVVFLGRLTFQKGPMGFLRAAARVREQVPDAAFQIAGAGDLGSRLEAAVADLGLEGHVTFTGFLDHAGVERLLDRADLCVLPSVSEPFGIAALESMRAGTPVIVSRTCGAAEVQRQPVAVDHWDVDRLADAIVSLLRDPARRALLAAAGRADARHASWTAAACAMLEVYRAVTSPRRAPHRDHPKR